MKIKFCGAAQTVTGSCHLVTLTDGLTILLDCGMFQGGAGDLEELNGSWGFNPSDVDVMVLSHAHIDHCGRIPKLVKDGFQGKIFCTHATRDLAGIMMMDTAHILEKDAEYFNEKVRKKIANRNKQDNHDSPQLKTRKALYNAKDVAESLEQFVSCSYDKWMTIAEGVRIQFRDAGHILGSANVFLDVKRKGDEYRLGFSGDIGRPNRPILRDPKQMLPTDILISESTYGDRLHLEKPAEVDRFLEIVKSTCTNQRGKLIIPAFSVGRTQELVFLLDQLVNQKKLPNIPVFVDSPLSVNATEIFKLHPECFDYELHQYMLKDPDPFGFKRLNYITDVNQSKKLNTSKEPCIIISSAGMINAGRIKHHVYNAIENPRNTILIVGYNSPETPGGILRSGATTLKLFGDVLMVNAKIEIMDSFSAHGDQKEMMDFLSNQTESVSELFLVHGELPTQEVFRTELLKSGFKKVSIPSMKQSVEIH